MLAEVLKVDNRTMNKNSPLIPSCLRRTAITIVFAFCLLHVADTHADDQLNVLCGIDVLQQEQFESLAGRRVGLITNHTGLNRDGVSTATLLDQSEQVNLVTLFSPEHGWAGTLDQSLIGDQRDRETGLKVVSLYGKTRVPSAEHLKGIDTLVFDIQDIGTRFYTYISTMGGAMKAAAEHGVAFVVLDRPNPIGGVAVQGPVLDQGLESFVGYHTMSVRHGMTPGELALMFRSEMKLDVDLSVVPVKNWRRSMWFDETGLRWTNPSPNMRSLTQATLYPGIGLLETTNLSVGRGTDTPFEVVGAPWIDCQELSGQLNQSGLSGVRFVPIVFTPDASKFKGESCDGVSILITNREEFDPIRTGLTLATTLHRLYRDDWNTASLNRLLCDEAVCQGIKSGKLVSELMSGYTDELLRFQSRRESFLLYEAGAAR